MGLSRRQDVDRRKLPASYGRHSGVITLHLDLSRPERAFLGHNRSSLTPHHYLVPYIAAGGSGNRHLDYQIGLVMLVFFRGQLFEPLLR